MAKNKQIEDLETIHIHEHDNEDEDEEDLEEVEDWDDWNEDENEDAENKDEFKCLFCQLNYHSFGSLLQHCDSIHHFDFPALRKSLGLDFYGCFKLVNYVRVMVSINVCWSCGHRCTSNQELQSHLHETTVTGELKLLWDDDKYLQPFLQGDSLLYSFDQDEDFDEDECVPPVDEEETKRILKEVGDMQIVDEVMVDADADSSISSNANGVNDLASSSDGFTSVGNFSRGTTANGAVRVDSSDQRKNDVLRASFANAAALEIRKVNESYFGSYSSFGIHREMLSDKVRTDAYAQAILKNPSLLNGASVLDVGCGTGILSLFAAQAGASRVVAVDASAKMASVASQIARDNGLLWTENVCEGSKQHTGVVQVVHGMVEDLDKSLRTEPHSIDVLVSEWMGYCLLYESMLSSVLFARDRWLKPGGAILPDTATMFAAGFGRGGTSLPFWENVYGFNMSSVGKELVEDAAKYPIVDVVDSHDIVTETAVLQTFDLASMKLEDMDFTSCIELQPKSCGVTEAADMKKSGSTWCHGVVLWFDTGFTSRFCREMPANLSTSPYTLKTHWSQTIFTFKEPIALSSEEHSVEKSSAIGTESCPASKVQLRISIARATEHRAIDISIETSGVGHDGRRRVWPVQIFNLS